MPPASALSGRLTPVIRCPPGRCQWSGPADSTV